MKLPATLLLFRPRTGFAFPSALPCSDQRRDAGFGDGRQRHRTQFVLRRRQIEFGCVENPIPIDVLARIGALAPHDAREVGFGDGPAFVQGFSAADALNQVGMFLHVRIS
jgi:hypothetical protein